VSEEHGAMSIARRINENQLDRFIELFVNIVLELTIDIKFKRDW